MKPYLMIAVAPFLIAAARPLDAETAKDVRCLVALASLAGSDSEEGKMAAVVGSQYFLGRIDGRSPGIDLEGAIRAEAEQLNEPAIRALLQSCGQVIKGRGEVLQGIGQRMQGDAAQSSSSS